MMRNLFEVRELTKIYRKGGVRANDRICMDVRPGEILGILGPNGAGKSTLIKQMTAMIAPTSGTIRYLGRNVTAEPLEVVRRLSYCAQDPYAITSLTTRDALVYTGRLRGMSPSDARARACALIARLQLEEVAHTRVGGLSGGQVKLVGIAAALVGRVEALILDEPTNALDPAKRRLVWDVIVQRNREEGTTVILVTHNVLEAEGVVDRVAVIDYGRLLGLDSVGRLKDMVDERLRIEVTCTFGRRCVAERALKGMGFVEVLGENRLRLYVDRDRAGRVLDQLVANGEEMACEEYKVIPPSLEDAYFLLGGKERIGHAG